MPSWPGWAPGRRSRQVHQGRAVAEGSAAAANGGAGPAGAGQVLQVRASRRCPVAPQVGGVAGLIEPAQDRV